MPTPRRNVDEIKEPKPGFLTTEFMLAIAVLLISGAMVIVSKNLDSEQWLDFAKWVVGGYAVSRGLAKVRL